MGRPEPESIFCLSPRAALDQLQTDVSQVDNPPTSLTKLADNVAWKMFKSIGKGQKAKLNTVFNLLEDLENLQFTSLEEYISAVLPKKITSQQIVDYNRLAWNSSFGKITEYKSNFSEQEQKGLSTNFSNVFEQKIPWFPGKKIVLSNFCIVCDRPANNN